MGGMQTLVGSRDCESCKGEGTVVYADEDARGNEHFYRSTCPTCKGGVLNNFGWAIERLKEGEIVSRSGWNGKGMYLGLQRPDADSANTLPYIYMITVQGDRVPWLASQTDMLAEDWNVGAN